MREYASSVSKRWSYTLTSKTDSCAMNTEKDQWPKSIWANNALWRESHTQPAHIVLMTHL
jgi:hypothetical protein